MRIRSLRTSYISRPENTFVDFEAKEVPTGYKIRLLNGKNRIVKHSEIDVVRKRLFGNDLYTLDLNRTVI